MTDNFMRIFYFYVFTIFLFIIAVLKNLYTEFDYRVVFKKIGEKVRKLE